MKTEKATAKSTPPRARPIGGISTSAASELMIVPNAAPMMMPTGMSSMLPKGTGR